MLRSTLLSAFLLTSVGCGSDFTAAETDSGGSSSAGSESGTLGSESGGTSSTQTGEAVSSTSSTGFPDTSSTTTASTTDSGDASSTTGGSEDTVVTYPGLPDNLYQSERYTVDVTQAGSDHPSHPSYVYESRNDLDPEIGIRPFMTDGNHWTSFSSSGVVTIQVTLPERKSLGSVLVHPLHLGISASVSGNQLTFDLETHENVYVEVEGEEDEPLFVFSNPLEAEPPSPDDPNVIYFEPGLHDPEPELLEDLPSGTTVYVAGGAYVRSLISAEMNASNITIRGRGILSGIHLPWVPEWGSHMLEMGGNQGVNNEIEGVTFTDGPKSNFVVNGEVSISNIRLLGWHRNNDGMTIGEGSSVEHLFAKVNDDVFKLYYSDLSINDVVIWQQPPGAAFQLSWNIPRDATNAHVSDVTIVHTDRNFGTFENRSIVGAVVSSRNFNGGSVADYLFEDFVIEGQPYQLFGLHLQDTLQGFEAGDGTISGLIFRNFDVAEAPYVPSFLNGNGLQTSEISNVTFDDLSIAGEHITATHNAANELVVSLENDVSGTLFE